MADQDLRRERISRVVDVVLACCALLALSPVMLVISAAVLVTIGRPIIFSQTRFGQGGKPFRIYKFRKFHVGKDCPGPLLTVRNDPRMSRIGQLLERTKLDELPQFFNVLRGDMAIVGPRPDTDVAGDYLTGEYRALLDYKPGIFGPGQVALRNAGSLYPPQVDPHTFYRERIFPLKAHLDLSYYPNRTLLKDLGWIVRGVLAVVGLHSTIRQLPAARGMPSVNEPAPGAGRKRASSALGSAAATTEFRVHDQAASDPAVG